MSALQALADKLVEKSELERELFLSILCKKIGITEDMRERSSNGDNDYNYIAQEQRLFQTLLNRLSSYNQKELLLYLQGVLREGWLSDRHVETTIPARGRRAFGKEYREYVMSKLVS